LAYLEAARAKLPDGAVGTHFRRLAIQRVIERATLQAMAGRRIQTEQILRELTARTLPGYAPASEAVAAFRAEVLSKIRDDSVATITLKPVTADASKAKTAEELARKATSQATEYEVAAVSGVSSNKPEANRLCQHGNRLLAEAISCERRSKGMPREQRKAMLKEAVGKLQECIDRYGQALTLDPNNREIEKKQEDASMFLYALRFKMAY
jgi:hypothetical protein